MLRINTPKLVGRIEYCGDLPENIVKTTLSGARMLSSHEMDAPYKSTTYFLTDARRGSLRKMRALGAHAVIAPPSLANKIYNSYLRLFGPGIPGQR